VHGEKSGTRASRADQGVRPTKLMMPCWLFAKVCGIGLSSLLGRESELLRSPGRSQALKKIGCAWETGGTDDRFWSSVEWLRPRKG